MGNCWTGVSEKKFLESERSVLQLSGLDVDTEIKIRNIQIDSIGNYVRTFEIISDSEKPTLVIMHGYGASAVIFWKIIKSLREDYNLILVDILGMGGSSRPKFTINNREEAEVYLVEWFEAWRLKYCQGGLTDFILGGHSFGGYISGLYAIKYHQHLRKLLMLSPAGITTYDDLANYDHYNELSRRLIKRGQKPPPRCLFKCCYPCVNKAWNCKCSPFGIMRCCGRCCVQNLMSGFVKRRFKSVSQEELVFYKEYLHQSLLKPGSTEFAIFLLMNPALQAFHPLDSQDRLLALPIPISFYFGDIDWMLTDSGQKIVDHNPYKGEHSHVFIIEKSDHHLYFDNPEGFVEAIKKDLSNQHLIQKKSQSSI